MNAIAQPLFIDRYQLSGGGGGGNSQLNLEFRSITNVHLIISITFENSEISSALLLDK